MVNRLNDIQTMGDQFLVDLVEQPVTSSESPDKNNILECKFEPKGKQRKQMRRTDIGL